MHIVTTILIDGSRHGSSSACRQMTIFYGGQAHVFDDVHPNKVCFLSPGLLGSEGTLTYCNCLAVCYSCLLLLDY